MRLTLQEKVLLVSIGYHFTVTLIAGGMAALGYFLRVQYLLDAGGLLMIAHGISFRRLGLDRTLQQALIRSHECHVCGLRISLTGVRWRCQCSFVSGPRSCLGPCPRCGTGFDSVVCPRCSTGQTIAPLDRQAGDRQEQRRR